ncbi:Bug family tripartite tricarboxylate transporter substrate binding protein [Paracandidimonas lactea]|uniref:Bug family tripartite tricarboxylate transporter substrate binding protein n=1 Tax=Paracandidimonas lactea TaxID=2895524 RepID=UPI001F32F883|nr:tripartite tricarboxylate transporter substrate binding protein [Paracandidimonas lactea]
MRLARALFLTSLLLGGGAASAQSYPDASVTIVVPYSPGGGTDIMARLIGQELSAEFGVSVVIDNKPGASGNIGTNYVANSKADGYTLLFTSSGHVINPSLFKKLPFDPVKSFEPVAHLASGPSVLVVNAQSGYKSTADLVAAGKAGKDLAFGSAGLGQPTHLVAEKFGVATGLRLLHIPYKGSGAAEIAVAGAEIDFLIDSIPAALPFIRSGKTRALAVTGQQRFPIDALTSVPTLAETGLGDFSFVTWWGVLAPAHTPKDRIATLSRALEKAMQSPALKQRFIEIGATPEVMAPEAFNAYITTELRSYRQLISDLNIQAQ